jgi:hypothetical protein
MAAGKLVLLLIAGGLAGAAFAGMTARSMHPVGPANGSAERPIAAARPGSDAYAGPRDHGSSWLDEGLSVLDSPAWPFGRGGWSQEPAPEPPPYDYAPPYDDGDGPNGDGDEPALAGPRNFADADRGQAYEDGAPAAIGGQGDAASAAAQNAANAAQDVIAAENKP